MGAYPYFYFAKYQTNIEKTLQALRQEEFNAGRYNPVISYLKFPITNNSFSLGANHFSIEEAIEASGSSGTRSILDILKISNISYMEALNSSAIYNDDFSGTSFPLLDDELIYLFDTLNPTHNVVEKVILEEEKEEVADEFWESIDRGTARHIVVYNNDDESEVFFAGYSFD